VPVTAAAAGLVAAGGVLAEEGLRALGSDISPFVEPKEGSSLRTGGAYEISRNPVYAGMLAAAAGLAVLRRRSEPLAAAAALAVVLHVKTGIEERRLRERFGEEYDAYARRTPRLLGLPSVRTV
jgi:protein-S-isoprenylcysteine O-methyltransferase Ste14